jgi:hypothetical protein
MGEDQLTTWGRPPLAGTANGVENFSLDYNSKVLTLDTINQDYPILLGRACCQRLAPQVSSARAQWLRTGAPR